MDFKPIVEITDYDQLRQTQKNTEKTNIAKGDVVVIDTADLTQRCVKHTTTADNPLVKGIAVETMEVGKERLIAIGGRALANVKTGATAIAVGDKLGTSTTAGKLGLVTNNPIVRALESVAINTEKSIVVEFL